MVNCRNSLYRFPNRNMRKFTAFTTPRSKRWKRTYNSYHDFLPKSRTLWEKKMFNFLLKNFPKYPFFDSPSTSDTISNLHLQNFLHRLIKTKKKRNVQFHETSHRDRRRWLRIEDIQGGKGSSLLIWKKNDFEKEAEEEPWKKKRGASRNFSKQSWLINTTVAR